MTKQQQFIVFSKRMHDKAHAITCVKNSDYSPGANPFSNFEKLKGRFGADFPVKLLVSRLQEKCDRVITYAVRGKNRKNTEPIENDFLDIANYAILTLGYLTLNQNGNRKAKRTRNSQNKRR